MQSSYIRWAARIRTLCVKWLVLYKKFWATELGLHSTSRGFFYFAIIETMCYDGVTKQGSNLEVMASTSQTVDLHTDTTLLP